MYRIFDHYKIEDVTNLVPCSINYKTQLNTVLDKEETFDHGRLTNAEYRDTDNNLVLSIAILYSTSSSPTHPLNRTTTRTWYDHSGINHNILDYDKTVKMKRYNVTQTVTEGQIRRRNIVNKLFASAVSMGYLTQASKRMREHSGEIDAYIAVGDTTLITGIQNDTTATWLDDAYPKDNTLTIRQVLVAGLTI